MAFISGINGRVTGAFQFRAGIVVVLVGMVSFVSGSVLLFLVVLPQGLYEVQLNIQTHKTHMGDTWSLSPCKRWAGPSTCQQGAGSAPLPWE